ncbi:MAG TPA: hypothetical protein VFE53_22805 [Mucilaginibacter sp.]|jgi:hypothetical protein|nr:hypothetical protein [Mucilaginibacter sp.]
MATQKTTDTTEKPVAFNPFEQMMEDKKKIVKTVKSGKKVSSVKGIKIVAPL